MNSHDELADRAALSLIAADLRFYRDLVFSPRFERVRAVSSLALMPFVSAFVFDSAEYIKRRQPAAVRELPRHDQLLITSRLRLKLLDDDRRSFGEILQIAHDLAAINSGWFVHDESGPLGALKNLLQKDLGIYFLQDEVICTTHIAFLNLGLSKEALAASGLSLQNIGPYLRNTTTDFGRYMAFLLVTLDTDASPGDSAAGISVPPVGFRDVKSASFYASMGGQAPPYRRDVCILLTSILSQVNTARILVPMLREHNDIAAFKIRFVSLFHAASSLQKLLDENLRRPFLTEDAVLLIRQALRSPAVRYVRKQGGFRRTLVHYGVTGVVASRLSPNRPLFGLVEAHVPGKSLTTMAQDVAIGLDYVADALRSLIPHGLTPSGTL